MSMVGYFAAVLSDTRERLRAEPDSIEEYLRPDDGEGEPPHAQTPCCGGCRENEG